MSHTATIDIDVKDASVVVKAAQRLGFEVQEQGEVRLYDGTVAPGMKQPFFTPKPGKKRSRSPSICRVETSMVAVI